MSDYINQTDGDFIDKMRAIERKAIAKYSPEELEEYDREMQLLDDEDDEL